MVRFLLTTRGKSWWRGRLFCRRVACLGLLVAALAMVLTTPAGASKRSKDALKVALDPPPDLLLDGGRKLSFERSFSLEREVKPKRSFWTRLVDVIAGEPDFHYLVNPYSVVTDSRGRIIVTDQGASGVHVFDFAQQKYKFITRRDVWKDPMLTPQCVAVDAQDNIYVTDSETGKVFVFDANGKFRRALGSLKGGEGYFKRPTGIAVDSAAQHIYVTDTLRNKIFMMDMQGSVLQTIGKEGTGDGEFNFPTELRLNGSDLVVVDAMNFRVQVLDRSGAFRYAIGKLGTKRDGFSVRKGLALTPKIICISSTDSGAWCRSSTARADCSTTSAKGARETGSSNCRPGCRLINGIASTWLTPITGGCRCFTITASPQVTGGKSEEALVAGWDDDCGVDPGACVRGGTEYQSHRRRAGHA